MPLGTQKDTQRTFVFKVDAKETHYKKWCKNSEGEVFRKASWRKWYLSCSEGLLEFNRQKEGKVILGEEQEKSPRGWSTKPHKLRSHFMETEGECWRTKYIEVHVETSGSNWSHTKWDDHSGCSFPEWTRWERLENSLGLHRLCRNAARLELGKTAAGRPAAI